MTMFEKLMAALLVLILSLAWILAGCGLLAGQVQAVNEDGELLYTNLAGEATTQAQDPETGVKFEPLMEYAEDGGLPAKGARLTKGLPSPWGELATGALGLVSAGVTAWAVRQNVKARANRRLAEENREVGAELVRAIEAEPAAKKAMVAKEKSHSPKLKKLVEYATPKKSVVNQKA